MASVVVFRGFVWTQVVANPHRPVVFTCWGPRDETFAPRFERKANFPRTAVVGSLPQPAAWAAGRAAPELALRRASEAAHRGDQAAREEAVAAATAAYRLLARLTAVELGGIVVKVSACERHYKPAIFDEGAKRLVPDPEMSALCHRFKDSEAVLA